MDQSYVDILIRIYAYDDRKGGYPVEATLSDGSEFVGDPLRLDLVALRKAEHELDPVAYGLQLFDVLFTGKIGRAYQKIAGKAEAETGGRLRVRLQIDPGAAELHALPWERIYHYQRGQEVALAATGLTPFSRYTGLEAAEPAPVQARTLQLLFAVANPTGMPFASIDVEEEVKTLHQALGGLRQASRFRITIMPGRTGLSPDLCSRLQAAGVEVVEGPTTPENLLRRLPQCHIFHFLGHASFARTAERGQGVATLHVEDEAGRWLRWSDAQIVDRLAKLTALPYLIFFAACDTAKRQERAENPFVGLGPKLVVRGVPAVVAMQDALSMPLARQLTGEFYRLLLEGSAVDGALNVARSLVFRPESFDWAVPVLFMRLREGCLIAEAPALPSVAVPVPPAPPRLYGRSRMLDDLAVDIHAAQVTALRGPAGVGKTALALALADHPDVKAAFPDGRAWLPLGPQPNVFSALGQLLAQFGNDAGKLDDIRKRSDQLRAVTNGKRWLLLLDDVWNAGDARPFLDACRDPGRALITTRSALIAADLHAANREVRMLQRQAAVEMLASTGDAARQAVAADPAAAAVLADMLGCLPLALHVTGRRLNRLAMADGPAGVAARLADELTERITAALELPAAEQRLGLEEDNPSLEAVLRLSYDALTEEARAAFRRLAVFGPEPLSFDAEAMAAVWDVEEEAATDLRIALVEVGLLERLEGAAEGTVRYGLHQVVAAFATACLAGAPAEKQAAALAHARHYAAIAKVIGELITGGANLVGLARLDREYGQIHRAVEWAGVAGGQEAAKVLAGLVLPLGDYMDIRSLHREYGGWLLPALAACRQTQDRAGEADCIQRLGYVHLSLDELPEARQRYEKAQTIYHAIGDRRGEANCIQSLGDVHRMLDEYAEARECYQEVLTTFQAIGDRRGEANCKWGLGDVLRLLDEYSEARQHYEEALIIYHAIGDRCGEASCIHSLGNVHLALAEYPEARECYQEALTIFRAIGDRLAEANPIRRLGDVHLALAEYPQARQRYEEAQTIYHDIDDRFGEANSIRRLGDVHLALAEYPQASQRYEEAQTIYHDIDDRLGEANCIQSLGDVHLRLAEYAEARQRYDEARPIYHEIGDRLGEANCIRSLGDAHLCLAEYAEARQRYEEARPIYHDIGDQAGEANVWIGLADVAEAEGNLVEAVACLRPALEFARQIEHPLAEELESRIEAWRQELEKGQEGVSTA
jgi:tetratricopeptide (TPR) repeat protein